MSTIGILSKIEDLRIVWKNEEKDFSAWLSREENLAILGKEIGIDLVLEERESPVGSFKIDILAKEDNTNQKIIIENQLTDTNHDHLGKVITYAAGKEADIIIWIVKKARDEHRKAIDWLNDHTDEKIGVFLVEIELWKIGDSLPAPKFKVVSKPNEWAKAMKLQMTTTQRLQLEFWEEFKNYASETDMTNNFNLTKARPQHWYNLSIGMSEAYISLTVKSQKKLLGVEIYMQDSKEQYEIYADQKEKIEKDLGFNMEWFPLPERKASRIIVNRSGDLKSKTKWKDFFNWYIEKAIIIKEVFAKYK